MTIMIIIAAALLMTATTLIILVIRRKSGNTDIEAYLKQLQETLQSTSIRQENIEKTLSNQGSILQQTQNQFSQRLDGINQTVGQRLDNAHQAVKGLELKMQNVEHAAAKVLEVGKDISSLQQILKAPKLRGGVGEQLLENLLSDILPRERFQMEYGFKDGERVDAVIKTEQGLVPIDSKFPIESFQRLAMETDEETKTRKRKEFYRDVKVHIDKIAKKYIRPSENTFDFALMYVPAENIYYEMISSEGTKDTPANYAASKRIYPVSPNTFYVYLNTILLGLKGMSLEKNIKEIIQQMSQVRVAFTKFQTDFDKIGKHLSNANSAYDSAQQKIVKVDNTIEKLEQPSIEVSAITGPKE